MFEIIKCDTFDKVKDNLKPNKTKDYSIFRGQGNYRWDLRPSVFRKKLKKI